MKRLIYPLAAALVIAADQFTKYLVRSSMQPGDRIPVIGKWMSIYYVRNTGTAFSMFAGNKFVTIIFTSALIVLCLILLVSEIRAGHRLVPLLLTFIASGGISNMIDRLSLGYVTDMISCWSFAVFNVADMFITCSCILAMIVMLILYKEEDKKDKSTESGGSHGR